MVKQWWRGMSHRQKSMVVVMLVVFLIITAAGIFGWVRTLTAGTSDAGETVGQQQPSTEQAQPDASGDAEGDSPDASTPESEDSIVVRGEYEFKVDENGMVEMPVTTDPTEAAAAAAAIAFSVDFSKLTRQEFVDTAIHRMTHPSEDYVGPEGEIHTFFETAPFQEPQREYWSSEQALQTVTDAWLVRDNPDRYTWWSLANGNTYDNFTLLPDHYWLAHPDRIIDEEQMAELDESLLPHFSDETDMEPDTPGATLTQWWVLSDVDNSKVGTAEQTSLHPAHFAIWCDAPEEGGLCGVAYTLDAEFPTVWPRQ